MQSWKQRLIDVFAGILSALAVSSIAVMATSWSDLQGIKSAVSENTITQKELRRTLIDVQIQMARITEKYITRTELESILDKRDKQNGP